MQECDIYLLDDVLAAVDASVAALLWERAICGLLKSKTRLVRPIFFLCSLRNKLVLRLLPYSLSRPHTLC